MERIYLHELIDILYRYQAHGFPFELEVREDYAKVMIDFCDQWKCEVCLNERGLRYFKERAQRKYLEYLRINELEAVAI
ncbi:hypothetical protein [Macrococcus brunensis]|uniref:hypothetical protein n=1 Tax=Macrococcus brunensis TaxID=198483 RepID=UPI001EEFE128|nr:hypothetical protein [Macrococcus brunensis]ULG72985.1 hypothetical protein MGG12_05570 [Macrococcus brunensis]